MSIYYKNGNSLQEFASKVSYDDQTNVLTINGESHTIGIDGDLYGNLGEVAYTTPTGLKKQLILHDDVYLCESNADAVATLNGDFSMKTVFESWECGEAYTEGNVTKWFGFDEFPANWRDVNDALEFNRTYCTDVFYPALTGGVLSVDTDSIADINWFSYHRPPTNYTDLLTQQPATSWKLYLWKYTNGLTGSQKAYSKISSDVYKYLYVGNNPYGYNYWVYNNSLSSVVQLVNVPGIAFYVSPSKYTDYVLDVECYSSDDDNDYIGLVGAYAVDSSTKKPSLLYFMKAGGVNDKCGNITAWDQISAEGVYTWYALSSGYNQGQFWPRAQRSQTMTGRPVLSAKPVADDDETSWARQWQNNKVRMRIQRSGNTIRAKVSQVVAATAATPSLDNGSEIVINLTSTDPVLSSFTVENGGAALGFITNSQPMTSWKVLSLKVPRTLYRLDTHEKLVQNVDGSSTTTIGKFNEEIGIGRLVTNQITRKTFYVGTSNFVKVEDNNSGGDQNNIEVVEHLPSNPDNDTFYFVTGETE